MAKEDDGVKTGRKSPAKADARTNAGRGARRGRAQRDGMRTQGGASQAVADGAAQPAAAGEDAAPVIGINAVRAALLQACDQAGGQAGGQVGGQVGGQLGALGGIQGGVRELWLDRARRDRRLSELVEQARAAGVPVRQQDKSALDEAAAGGNHQGALVWTHAPVARGEADLIRLLESGPTDPLLLVLDGVTDPHNLGACLRSADGAGALAVIAPRDRAVGLNATAIKVASGAAASMPFVRVTNLARTLTQLRERGLWVVGLAGEATQNLFALELQGPLALVLGGEGKGLRRLTRERCDQLASLPMRGRVESLNVSVSAGICLYEALRQRSLATPAR